MYREYFGLTKAPFQLTPDTKLFAGLPQYSDAMNTIGMGLSGDEGFIKVVGEVGTGKTMLCRMLLNHLNDNAHAIYIPNPVLTPGELHVAVASELGIEVSGEDTHSLFNLIHKELIELRRNRKRSVLVIDEIQAMPEETIEAMRLLANLELEDGKLLQVVLFGHPEFDEMLAQKSLRQLNQRISLAVSLDDLGLAASKVYIQQRLLRAGYQGTGLFTKQAIEYIHAATNGNPRLTNVVCHKALLLAFGRGVSGVELQQAKDAVADVPALKGKKIKVKSSTPWGQLIGFAFGAAVVGAAVVFVLTQIIPVWSL